jgi:hypothetical protein
MFLQIQELGAAIINAISGLATLGLLAAFLVAGHLFQQDANSRTVMSSTLITLGRDARAADAIEIPSVDVGGQANTDGHQLTFYRRNAPSSADSFLGTGHWWIYCYKSNTNQCVATQPVNTLAAFWYNRANGATTPLQAPIQGLNAFSAIELQGSAQLDASSEIAPYAVAHPGSCTPQTYHWGYNDSMVINGSVVASGTVSTTCSVFRVTLTSQKLSLTVPISNTVVPQEQTTTVADATPTPNPEIISNSISFRAPIANPTSAAIFETNYGTRTTSPAQVYTVGAPATGPTCAPGRATYAPKPTVTPGTGGAGKGTITFTPVISAAAANTTCSITLTDNVGQVASIGVAIGQIFNPTSDADSNMSFNAGATVSVGVSEQNYDLPAAQGGNGGFTHVTGFPSSGVNTSPSSVCTGPSLQGTPTLSGTNYTESEMWGFTFKTAGTCTIVFTDVYGNNTKTNVHAYDPDVWPPFIKYPVPGFALANCVANQPRAFAGAGFASALSNQADPGGSGIHTDANGCLLTPSDTAVDMTKNASVSVTETAYHGNFSLSNSVQIGTACTNQIGNGGPKSTPTGPNATWIVAGQVSTSGASCNYALVDSTGSITSDNTVTVQVAGLCTPGIACYLEYDNTWSKPTQCVGKSTGDDCDGNSTADDIYYSEDGGQTWAFYFQALVLSLKQCVTPSNVPNVTIVYYDRQGIISPTSPAIGTTGLPITGNAGDPPSPTPPACTVVSPG